jgi:hypothetical protein
MIKELGKCLDGNVHHIWVNMELQLRNHHTVKGSIDPVMANHLQKCLVYALEGQLLHGLLSTVYSWAVFRGDEW